MTVKFDSVEEARILAAFMVRLLSVPEWLTDPSDRRNAQGFRDEAMFAIEHGASRTVADGASSGAMLSTAEFATLRHVTPKTVRVWCRTGRLPQAIRLGQRSWGIPADAEVASRGSSSSLGPGKRSEVA